MIRKRIGVLIACWILVANANGRLSAAEIGESAADPTTGEVASPAEQIVNSIGDPLLRDLADQVLRDNPAVASAEARARAIDQRAPQVKALPDPTAGITGFVDSPETRVGPQRLTLNVSQSLPWTGKNASRQESARFDARAAKSDVEALKLRRLTEIRRIYWELAFLAELERITEQFHTYLEQHEGIAQGRYSTGVGTIQGVIRLQAEITGIQIKLIEIRSRRVSLESEANTLRARPATDPLPFALFPDLQEVVLQREWLRQSALSRRPELQAADDRIASREALIDWSDKQNGPDFKVGMVYTFVDKRQDEAGKLNPPEDNGKDIFGIQAGIKIPLWGGRVTAGVEEATQMHQAELEARREVEAMIAGELGDLSFRIPLIWEQVRLLEDMLLVQADEARQSVKSGYIAGTLNVLDLLDAERVLFEARIAAARSSIDYEIGLASLEGVVAAPLGLSRSHS